MEIRAIARSGTVRPFSSATPNSVMTVSTRFRLMVTAAPGVSSGLILEMVPFFVVELRR